MNGHNDASKQNNEPTTVDGAQRPAKSKSMDREAYAK
jgi:hypothetical protein